MFSKISHDMGHFLPWHGLNVVCNPRVTERHLAVAAAVQPVELADGRVMAIEVKSAREPGWREAQGIRTFLDEYGDAAIGGLLLHGGTDVYSIAPDIIAAPWWRAI